LPESHMIGVQDFYLKAKTKIWPGLSSLCHIRLKAVPNVGAMGERLGYSKRWGEREGLGYTHKPSPQTAGVRDRKDSAAARRQRHGRAHPGNPRGRRGFHACAHQQPQGVAKNQHTIRTRIHTIRTRIAQSMPALINSRKVVPKANIRLLPEHIRFVPDYTRFVPESHRWTASRSQRWLLSGEDVLSRITRG